MKVAIVEDGAKDLQKLKEGLARYAYENGTEIDVNEFASGEAFLQSYDSVYDVVFLDIMMPGLNGMDLAGELRKRDEVVPIIFVTDAARYAIQGYRVNATDFFVKPVSYYDLKLRMDRIHMYGKSSAQSVVIRIPYQGVKVMQSQSVYYVEVRNKELTYHTAEGNYTMRGESLKNLEKELGPAGFARCSSSYLVNLSWCRELSGDTLTVAGDKIRISRSLKKEFITKLSESLSNCRLSGGYPAERG